MGFSTFIGRQCDRNGGRGAFRVRIPSAFLSTNPGFLASIVFSLSRARPSPEGLQALAAMRIKTDLDIEDDSQAISAERGFARRLGMQFVSVPLSGFFEPSDADMAKIFQVIQNPANYPIYLHCKHGHDRTGLVVGLYRVFDERWTPERAYSEMLAHGFHPLLLGLNHYFKEKTELNLAEELQ